ncbi:hypothetical protein [Streptomyces sp. NPDC059916]|uniref:hypothetical protein n=1 Tax=Streptomyces sp. NPDC059916 TaxID=3347001 RepID=UPI0036BB9E70
MSRREWMTGECWLYCERSGVLVLYVGPLQEDGQHAPIYACEDCLNRLRGKARRYNDARDRAPAR